jgi:hypothetical protein
MKSSSEIDKTLFDPPLISTLTAQSIERERLAPEFLNIGDNIFGDKFVMARKSKVIGLLGDTSQGKTSLMRHIAENMSKQIDGDNNEVGLFVTWEDNVEDFGMIDFANFSKIPVKSLYNGQVKEGEFNRLLQAEAARAKSPLWLAGHSEMSEARPMLNMTDVFSICENLKNKQGKFIQVYLVFWICKLFKFRSFSFYSYKSNKLWQMYYWHQKKKLQEIGKGCAEHLMHLRWMMLA